MSLLLHCIYRIETDALQLGPHVICLASGRLGAVVSSEQPEPASRIPSLEALRNYERLVEAAHLSHTVIPIRYGCRFASEASVLRLLEEHHPEYERLLDRLHGKAEMALRLLFPSAPANPIDPSPGSGRAYLDSLRKHVGRQQLLTEREALLADRWTAMLREGCVESKREVLLEPQGRLISLYFLVEWPYIERFRSVARSLCPPTDVRSLLSGPWPPYNFTGSSVFEAMPEAASA